MAYIKNFYQVTDLISCSGQPTEAQLIELEEQGYEVIINLGLLDTLYALKDEKASVKALGMYYLHIPVLFETPQLTDLSAFIDKMSRHDGKKIHIHCAANFRGICFAGLWLYYKGIKTADEMMNIIGELWLPDTTWQAFIKDGVAYIDDQKAILSKTA